MRTEPGSATALHSAASHACGHSTIAALITAILQAKFLKDRSYVPRFNACFEHYLMHTGGRGVLDSLAKEPLALSEKQLSASRQTLARYGNTSAASTW